MPQQRKKNSVLSSLLFGVNQTIAQGRIVKFDEQIPDIKLSTGTMRERVIAALENSQPLTAREVAERIGSNQPRTSAKIRELIDDGVVVDIKLDGCITEYMLCRDSD